MAFHGPVYSTNKIGKNMGNLYMIECIQYELSFYFGANWTRIGGVIGVPGLFC